MYIHTYIQYGIRPPVSTLHRNATQPRPELGHAPRANHKQRACVRAVPCHARPCHGPPCHACVHTAGRVFRFAPSRFVSPRFVSFRRCCYPCFCMHVLYIYTYVHIHIYSTHSTHPYIPPNLLPSQPPIPALNTQPLPRTHAPSPPIPLHHDIPPPVRRSRPPLAPSACTRSHSPSLSLPLSKGWTSRFGARNLVSRWIPERLGSVWLVGCGRGSLDLEYVCMYRR